MFSVCPFFLLLTQPKINERPLSFVLSIFYMVTLHEQIMRYNEYTIGLTWGHFSDGDNEVLFIVQ